MFERTEEGGRGEGLYIRKRKRFNHTDRQNYQHLRQPPIRQTGPVKQDLVKLRSNRGIDGVRGRMAKKGEMKRAKRRRRWTDKLDAVTGPAKTR